MQIIRLLNGKVVAEDVSPVFDMQCQVLCVGAGCAGTYAADAAARNGAKVILLENDITIGGMHILGNVRGYYYGFEGGSFEEDDQAAQEANVFYHKADQKRVFLLRRLQKSGVNLYCGYTPTALLVDGNRVRGVLAFDGEKEIVIRADVTIDATSDGFLIRMLPVEKSYGRSRGGQMAPFSVFSTFFDGEKYRMVNRDAGYIDPYDCRDFSRKTMHAHRQASNLVRERQMLNLASHTGVREGLRFQGEEMLRYEDVLLGRTPEKVLFWAYSDLDVHGHLRALDDELFQTWWVVSNLATAAIRIPVPMGAVVPKGWRGIVTAGRCLSADSYMQNAVRMVRDMFRMGECVGTAAAIAALEHEDFGKIDYPRYLEIVKRAGCYAGDESKEVGFDFPKKNRPYQPIVFDFDKTFPLLRTETPGVAIWSAFNCKSQASAADRLAVLLDETDSLCRYNAAIALGVMGDQRALPVLRELLQNRDCFYFKDCRRSNQFRSVIAVCLLGRIGEPCDIPFLSEIVFDEKEFSKEMYHTLEPDYLYYKGSDRNFLYFDMVTHGGAALVKIHHRFGLATEKLKLAFIRLLEEGKLEKRIAPRCLAEDAPREEARQFLEEMIRSTDVNGKRNEGKA